MAEVRDAIDRRPTDVHRDLRGVALLERADGACGCVVEAEHSDTVIRP